MPMPRRPIETDSPALPRWDRRRWGLGLLAAGVAVALPGCAAFKQLGLDGAARASVGDLLLAAIAWIAGITVGLLLFAVTLPLAPIGYVVLRSLRK